MDRVNIKTINKIIVHVDFLRIIVQCVETFLTFNKFSFNINLLRYANRILLLAQSFDTFDFNKLLKTQPFDIYNNLLITLASCSVKHFTLNKPFLVCITCEFHRRIKSCIFDPINQSDLLKEKTNCTRV